MLYSIYIKQETYSWSLDSSVNSLSLEPRTTEHLNPIAAHLALMIMPMSGFTRLILLNSRRTSLDRGSGIRLTFSPSLIAM